jgi:hypothetical protein
MVAGNLREMSSILYKGNGIRKLMALEIIIAREIILHYVSPHGRVTAATKMYERKYKRKQSSLDTS